MGSNNSGVSSVVFREARRKMSSWRIRIIHILTGGQHRSNSLIILVANHSCRDQHSQNMTLPWYGDRDYLPRRAGVFEGIEPIR